MITSLEMAIDAASLAAGTPDFRLHLYAATPTSTIADNSPFALPSDDRSSYLGFVDICSPEDLNGTLYVDEININKQVKLVSADIFARLATKDDFTSAGGGEVYRLKLHSQAV